MDATRRTPSPARIPARALLCLLALGSAVTTSCVSEKGDGNGSPGATSAIEILAPRGGAELTATSVLRARVAGGGEIQFVVDGSAYGAPLGSPWELALDARRLSTGRHEVSAVAIGSAEKAAPVSFFVDNTPPGAPIGCVELAATAGSLVGNRTLSEDCDIFGDLVLNGATLNAESCRLVVYGDIRLTGAGALRVLGGALEQPNAFDLQFEISAGDDALILLRDTELITTAGGGASTAGSYSGRGRSLLRLERATLDPSTSWLLGEMADSASIQLIASENIPTELYPRAGASLTIVDNVVKPARVWLRFDAGQGGDIASFPSLASPFDYRLGRGTPGAWGVGWLLEVENGLVDFAVESHPGSDVTVRNNAAPVTIGYHYENLTQSEVLQNLPGGAEALVSGAYPSQGRNLTLDNALLSPLSWQFYARNDTPRAESLTIRNSIVNEVGAVGNSIVNVEDSILQLALLIAWQGSELNVANSTVNSHSVLARDDSQVLIEESDVWGAQLQALDTSRIVLLNNRLHGNECHVDCSPPLAGYCDVTGVGDSCNPFSVNTTGRPIPRPLGPDAAIVIVGIDEPEGPFARSAGSVDLTGDAAVYTEAGALPATYSMTLRPVGAPPPGGFFLADVTAIVEGGALGALDVSGLSPGPYTITLFVTAPVPVEVAREIEVIP